MINAIFSVLRPVSGTCQANNSLIQKYYQY